MNRIDDERVRFYLKHQDLIDTWAAVRKDVQETTHGFYLSLADDLAGMAADLDDAVVWSNEGTWSKVGLYRDSWPSSDGEPLVQVCLEWYRQATFTDGTKHVGIRVPYSVDEAKSLRPYLGDAVRGIRASHGFGKSSNHWPAYRPAPQAEDDFWEDLAPYREEVIEKIEEAWGAFAEPIDEALQRWRAQR